MTLGLLTERQLARWYPLRDHPVQHALVHDPCRYKVCAAGRRSGKTERAKRYIAKAAMSSPGERYFIAAPTRDQVKRIYWSDMKALALTSAAARRPSETELTIYLDNGSEIQLVGLDQPARIEGSRWSGGVIDEIADIKPDAWEANVKPALDTFDPQRPDYRPWCWLIGVPESLDHFYDLAEYARTSGDPEWAYYHWESADILPADVIAAAKRQMSPRQFRIEYCASFEGASGRIYEDYGPDNLTRETIRGHEQLLWYHDFNYTPLSSGIGVRRGDSWYLLEEIILTSAVARQSAMEFVQRYRDHYNKQVLIYGDPAGRAGEKHSQASNYTEIEGVLRGAGWELKRLVRPAAPSIVDRQNAVRAMIRNAAGEVRLFVNPSQAPYTHKGLATVQLKKGSTFLEEDGDYQHITTAVGYMIDYECPVGRGRVSVQGLRV